MAKKPKIKLKRTIGRFELIDLPDLNLKDIPAKIDTGAYTSSIHCDKIQIVIKEGNKFLKAHFYSLSGKKKKKHILYFLEFEKKRIKNSFGKSEWRYVVKKKVKIFDELIETDFSLSNRTNLKFPVLLGRKFLKGKFVVDVAKSNLNKKIKKLQNI